jgi:hypothetical protein
MSIVIEGSYRYDELHQAIEGAIIRAYKRKGPVNELDRKQAVENVMEVLKRFSRRKRGPRFDESVTAAIRIFQEELKSAGLSLAKYKSLTPEKKRELWNHIWATRQAEIITDELKLRSGRLITERGRIRDRVTRSFSGAGGKRTRINYRLK